MALYVLAAQEVHVVVPGADQVPRGQHTPAPLLLLVPKGQLKQALIESRPVFELYLPAGQLKHVLEQSVGLNLPTGQIKHAHNLEPAREVVPEGHDVQEEEVVPAFELKEPTLQLKAQALLTGPATNPSAEQSWVS